MTTEKQKKFHLSFNVLDEEEIDERMGEALAQAGAKPEKGPPNYSLSTISGCLAAATPAVMGFLWVAEAVWVPLGTFLYLTMMGISFAIVSDMALSKKKAVRGAGSQALTLTSMVAIVVSFSQISRHYYIAHGGFEAETANYWHWNRYGTSAVANAMLRGVPTVWGWPMTEIRPVAFWPRVMLFLFQLAADVLAIGGLLRFVGKLFTQRPTVRKSGGHYLAYMAQGIGQILGLALWSIPLAMGIDAMLHDGWNPASTWPAIRMVAPVVLGSWLALRSLRALRLFEGLWSRLGAAVGAAIGVGLIWISWPVVQAFL